MTPYGRVAGRGLNHILRLATEHGAGIAACGALIQAIGAHSVPDGTVCRACLDATGLPATGAAHREPELLKARPDTPRISLPQASRECGLALSSLQQAARLGRLRTEKPSPRVRLTTRRWLRDYLESRPERFRRRASKPSATEAAHSTATT